MSYYKKQLNQVKTDGQYAPPFKIGDTRWMDLNKESAEALREWLDERFPRTDKKSEL